MAHAPKTEECPDHAHPCKTEECSDHPLTRSGHVAPGVSGRTLYHPLTLPDEVFPPSNLKPDSEKADMREVILPRPVDFPAPQTHGTSSSLIQRVSHPVSLISKPSTTSSFGTIAFLVSCHGSVQSILPPPDPTENSTEVN